ncbi:MAG: ferritin-like domain-containing protein [Planctomycetaceae bacterium]|nr:ferritin-like domain-containing protein [Planctomycetaceae bacterium]
MKLDTLDNLFVMELKDLLSAEKQLVKALPKMAKGATSEALRAAFEEHLEQTKGQIERLEQVFALIDKAPRAEHCKAMEGLIAEGSELLEEDGEPAVKDAALIGAAQKVEHYEISGYGTARALAELLGLDEAVDLLQETLDEEKETDENLTKLALNEINVEAKSADGD